MLADAASDLLLLILEIQRPGIEPPTAQVLRERIKARLTALETEAERSGVGRPDIDDTKYALVATIDESLHFSGWASKLGWDIQPLQVELFGDRNAGVRFYEKLAKARERSREVVEVYHLCLCLGFQGRYRIGGREELARLLDDLAAELGGEPAPLSPRALPKGPPPSAPRAFPWIPAAGGVLALSVAVALGLYFLLDGAREEALAVMRVFGS